MQIYGPTHLHGPQAIRAPHITPPPEVSPAERSSSGSDEVEISAAARLLDAVRELPEIRQDRVQEIRTAIANGTYETEEKLQIALERLLDEIA